jgi:oligopeptide/dipeptide ABC transporter ATP-binding protein
MTAETTETPAAPQLTETLIEDVAPVAAEHHNIGEVILDVRDLRTSFRLREGTVHAVTGVNFSVRRGEILGLVGESGCGKSVTSLSIMGLVAPPGVVESGQIMFDGQDLRKLDDKQMRGIRGNRISMIFQQPTSSLNPVMRVGVQIGEVLQVHKEMKKKVARERAMELMRMVGIPDPKRRIDSYPFEMSGGMAQRVMIAMELACEPELLIADEPTTALDVTIQAQILDLMRRLQRETGTAIVLITHDLGVVAEMCDRVAVMYAGEIIEETDSRSLFRQPLHPYTQGLIGSVPVLGQPVDALSAIPGLVPNLINLPQGCRFAPRCGARVEHDVSPATEVHPELLAINPKHTVRCWLYHTSEETPDWKPPLADAARADALGAAAAKAGAP